MQTEAVDTAAAASQPPPIASPGNEPEPNLHVAGVTKARCGEGHTITWTDTPMTKCPTCDGKLTIVAATGQTASEAIARAAQELPDRVERVRQPSIPGLKPAFNFEAAFTSITEKRHELRIADTEAELVGDKHKALRKRADGIRGQLDALIDELEDRQADARYAKPDESTADEAPASLDVWKPLQAHLAKAGATVTLEQIAAWTPAQQDEANTWASDQIKATKKDKLGHHTSLQWPEHVAEAHHGPEPARKATKRHASPSAAAKAKQKTRATVKTGMRNGKRG